MREKDTKVNIKYSYDKDKKIYSFATLTLDNKTWLNTDFEDVFQLYNVSYTFVDPTSKKREFAIKNTMNWRYDISNLQKRNLDENIYGRYTNMLLKDFTSYKHVATNLYLNRMAVKNGKNDLIETSGDEFYCATKDRLLASNSYFIFSKSADAMFINSDITICVPYILGVHFLKYVNTSQKNVEIKKVYTRLELYNSDEENKDLILRENYRVKKFMFIKFKKNVKLVSWEHIEDSFYGIAPLIEDSEVFKSGKARKTTPYIWKTADTLVNNKKYKFTSVSFQYTNNYYLNGSDNLKPRLSDVNGSLLRLSLNNEIVKFNEDLKGYLTKKQIVIPVNNFAYDINENKRLLDKFNKPTASLYTKNYYLYNISGNTIKFPNISDLPYEISTSFTVSNYNSDFKLNGLNYCKVSDYNMVYSTKINTDVTLNKLLFYIYDFNGNKFIKQEDKDNKVRNFKDFLISYEFKKMVDKIDTLNKVLKPAYTEIMIFTADEKQPHKEKHTFIKSDYMNDYFSKLKLTNVLQNKYTCVVEVLSVSIPTKNSITHDENNRRLFVCVTGVETATKLTTKNGTHDCLSIISLTDILNWKHYKKEKTRVDINLDRKGPQYSLPFYTNNIEHLNGSQFYFLNNETEIQSFDKDSDGSVIDKPVLPHLTVKFSFYRGDVGW